jgi:hypothetical protein
MTVITAKMRIQETDEASILNFMRQHAENVEKFGVNAAIIKEMEAGHVIFYEVERGDETVKS